MQAPTSAQVLAEGSYLEAAATWRGLMSRVGATREEVCWGRASCRPGGGVYIGFGGIVRCAKKSGWTGIPADILFGAYATWWHFSVDVELM